MQELNSHWWNQLCHGLMTWHTSIHPSLHPTYIHLKKRRRKRKKKQDRNPPHTSPSRSSLPPPRNLTTATYAARFRLVPVALAGAQHRSELPCYRSSLPSGQIRLSRPRELTHDPSPLLGFRGWRPLQLRRVAGDSAPPSPTPTASPTGGSASWSVLLHPVAAGRTHAAGKLRRDGGALHRLKHPHGEPLCTPLFPPFPCIMMLHIA